MRALFLFFSTPRSIHAVVWCKDCSFVRANVCVCVFACLRVCVVVPVPRLGGDPQQASADKSDQTLTVCNIFFGCPFRHWYSRVTKTTRLLSVVELTTYYNFAFPGTDEALFCRRGEDIELRHVTSRRSRPRVSSNPFAMKYGTCVPVARSVPSHFHNPRLPADLPIGDPRNNPPIIME